MAITATQKEQIILCARKDATAKVCDIARMYEVTPTQASTIIYRAKQQLGDDFYLNGQKAPTANYLLVLGCLERAPNMPVTISSIMRQTGLSFDQVKCGVKILVNNHGKHVERGGQTDQTYFVYKPADAQRELVRKPQFADVFNMMNQLGHSGC